MLEFLSKVPKSSSPRWVSPAVAYALLDSKEQGYKMWIQLIIEKKKLDEFKENESIDLSKINVQ